MKGSAGAGSACAARAAWDGLSWVGDGAAAVGDCLGSECLGGDFLGGDFLGETGPGPFVFEEARLAFGLRSCFCLDGRWRGGAMGEYSKKKGHSEE
ncbi:MAG: hypothetical protein AAFW83_12760 [Pseudomonadota bacterium]